jgi:hypothetical protein
MAAQFWAQVFMGLVFFVIAGFLWFFVVRPILEDWNLIAPRDSVDQTPEPAPRPVRSAAFTNTGTESSTASEPLRTERTPEAQPEPGVQIANLEGADLQTIVDALERRGYLCLSPTEQGVARDLVYHTERAARFDPAGERSKTAVIERATGMRRGGGKDYQRASKVYDNIVGKPPPAVSNLAHQEAKIA